MADAENEGEEGAGAPEAPEEVSVFQLSKCFGFGFGNQHHIILFGRNGVSGKTKTGIESAAHGTFLYFLSVAASVIYTDLCSSLAHASKTRNFPRSRCLRPTTTAKSWHVDPAPCATDNSFLGA